jgi:hypothetical protein
MVIRLLSPEADGGVGGAYPLPPKGKKGPLRWRWGGRAAHRQPIRVIRQLQFREHSGNIQGTFGPCLGNIQGTFGPHSGNTNQTTIPVGTTPARHKEEGGGRFTRKREAGKAGLLQGDSQFVSVDQKLGQKLGQRLGP